MSAHHPHDAHLSSPGQGRYLSGPRSRSCAPAVLSSPRSTVRLARQLARYAKRQDHGTLVRGRGSEDLWFFHVKAALQRPVHGLHAEHQRSMFHGMPQTPRPKRTAPPNRRGMAPRWGQTHRDATSDQQQQCHTRVPFCKLSLAGPPPMGQVDVDGAGPAGKRGYAMADLHGPCWLAGFQVSLRNSPRDPMASCCHAACNHAWCPKAMPLAPGVDPSTMPLSAPQLAHRQGRHSWEADNAAQYLHVNWCLTPLPDLWLDNRARMFPLSSRPRPPDTSSCRLPVCRDHGASRVSYQWDCPGLRPSPCNCSAGVQVPCRTVQYSKGDGKMSRTSIQPGQPSMFQNEMRPGTQSEPATSQRKASPQRGSTGGGEGGGPHEDQPVSLTPPHCTGAGPGRQSQQSNTCRLFCLTTTRGRQATVPRVLLRFVPSDGVMENDCWGGKRCVLTRPFRRCGGIGHPPGR
ncbi:hypothetical protein ACCO45_006865 [Purpureocillium lilacinum]|uniref:Uncharacterized protein n=1 Tax=Purpureocillium lilacinum TaxID=33203 RepID=A0ACC4DTU5_PURLI